MSAHGWANEANCIGYPLEVFFPHGYSTTQQALDACAGCPVIQQCLNEALYEERRSYITWGIRGGLTARQRDSLRKALTR